MGPLEHGDPERIGRYRLIGRLGAGGMGQVYFGRSAGGRPVAVKRIHPHLATDNSFRERFAREVTAARQVSGAFTAPVIDADPEGDVPWLVTSYVPSLPLDEAVRAYGGLPEHTLRVLTTGLAEALAEIHRVGLIHRDLKPGNVLLAEDGPRVIDFGIARATEGTAATQSIIGTPGFMSPEQVQGEHLTPSSDMFAFGAVLVYAAGGVGPFGEGAMPTLVMRILQHEPDLSAVPASLQRLVSACLAKDARNRPSPGQLLDALGDVPIGESWLPPDVKRGVRDQVDKTNAALSGGAAADGADTGGATSFLGGAAASAAAGSGLGDHDPTRAAGGAVAGADATSVMGAGAHAGGTGQTPQPPPPYHPDGPQAGQAGATRAYGQTPAPTTGYGERTRAYEQQGPDRTPAYGSGPQQAPPTAAVPPAGDDAYAGMYRDSGPRAPAQPYQDDGRRQEEEQRRRQREQQQREQQQREQQQREEQQREEQRRRQEAERAHRERMRAEQDAARRAQAQARHADQPGLWSFAKLLPLLIIPIIQIPLGIGVSYAWQWFTTESGVWTGQEWVYSGVFTLDGFFHALYLGYFLLNNVVAAEFLIRSLRTAYVVGAMLALAVVAGTNGMLFYSGFFGST
ncbi:serine/threonine-protein kinase [Streptomonospora litoralis]|uniref:non-specific serine/threonine protein kinase n=1 Tax=Streptomonospora litoralis TaxID=2498135 RepID=A0A4P6Q1M6_9ACTN|nr:serine/threonine-protein kinase [Streptomonospora litoralis]QBI54488.1 Serine/threonine-protein kinase AfsK [Streptomonospora litoralis]